jgi:hypothetical protein
VRFCTLETGRFIVYHRYCLAVEQFDYAVADEAGWAYRVPTANADRLIDSERITIDLE